MFAFFQKTFRNVVVGSFLIFFIFRIFGFGDGYFRGWFGFGIRATGLSTLHVVSVHDAAAVTHQTVIATGT